MHDTTQNLELDDLPSQIDNLELLPRTIYSVEIYVVSSVKQLYVRSMFGISLPGIIYTPWCQIYLNSAIKMTPTMANLIA